MALGIAIEDEIADGAVDRLDQGAIGCEFWHSGSQS